MSATEVITDREGGMNVELRRRPWGLPAAAAGGLAVGVLTLLGGRYLPGASDQLANSGAAWGLAAFAAGALVRPARAALAGAVVLVGEVVGFYALAAVRLGTDPLAAWPLVWLAVAVLAGPVFGLAGRWWRHGDRRRRAAGAALPGGAFLAEAGYLAFGLHYRPQALLFAAIGVLLPVALGRTAKDRKDGLLVLVPLTVLVALGYLVLYAAAGLVT